MSCLTLPDLRSSGGGIQFDTIIIARFPDVRVNTMIQRARNIQNPDSSISFLRLSEGPVYGC
jgi:hypothetical protein